MTMKNVVSFRIFCASRYETECSIRVDGSQACRVVTPRSAHTFNWYNVDKWVKDSHLAAQKIAMTRLRELAIRTLSRVSDRSDGPEAKMLTLYTMTADDFAMLRIAMSCEDVLLSVESRDHTLCSTKLIDYKHETRRINEEEHSQRLNEIDSRHAELDSDIAPRESIIAGLGHQNELGDPLVSRIKSEIVSLIHRKIAENNKENAELDRRLAELKHG
jgi:hypothetical protein